MRLLTAGSLVRVQLEEPWLRGQAVKTPPFHGGNRGSIPLGVTIKIEQQSLAAALILKKLTNLRPNHRFIQSVMCTKHTPALITLALNKSQQIF